jgi:hypothetical protein
VLPNAFIGLAARPDDAHLTLALGSSRHAWDQLVAALAADCDVEEWKSYSPKAGWTLRLLRGKRAIVYLSPGKGDFTASFALGDRAIEAAHSAGLPGKIMRIIREARKYAEGTGVRIDVKTARDVPAVCKLAAIKLAN